MSTSSSRPTDQEQKQERERDRSKTNKPPLPTPQVIEGSSSLMSSATLQQKPFPLGLVITESELNNDRANIFRIILKFLDRQSLMSLRISCKLVKKMLDDNYFNVAAKLQYAQCTPEFMKKLIRSTTLHGVHFDCRAPPLAKLLPLLPQTIKVLNLSWCNDVTADIIQLLPHNLLSLDLSNCEILDSFISLLPSTIQHLSLIATAISDEAIKNHSNLNNLQSLDISYCKNITYSGVKGLSNCTHLKTLNIRGCPALFGDKVVNIPDLFPSLEQLDISWCYKITEDNINDIKKKMGSRVLKSSRIAPPPPTPEPTVTDMQNARAKRYLRREGVAYLVGGGNNTSDAPKDESQPKDLPKPITHNEKSISEPILSDSEAQKDGVQSVAPHEV